MQHPSKSWTLDPVCPLYPSIYYQKTLQEAKKIHTVQQKRLFICRIAT